jgi:hypothetical protein
MCFYRYYEIAGQARNDTTSLAMTRMERDVPYPVIAGSVIVIAGLTRNLLP